MLSLSARPNRKTGIDMIDYCHAAASLSIPVPRVRAVDAVESANSGFLPSGRPKILFEGHIFHSLTGGRFSRDYPTISYPRWTVQFYKGGEAEYKRLEQAYRLDPHAAIQSASWGRFQILAENYKFCGYASPEEMVEAMFEDEDNHLEAFIAYVKNHRLDDELRRGDFAAFAAGYNGPAYKRNQYDIKLTNADKKFSKIKIDCKALLESEQVSDLLPCTEACGEFASTSLDSRYTSPSVETETVDATDQKQKPNSNPADPSHQTDSTTTSDPHPSTSDAAGTSTTAPDGSSSKKTLTENIDGMSSKLSYLQDKFDLVKGVCDRMSGMDSVKSLLTIVLSTIKQIALFFIAFLLGIPLQYWAVLAVLLAVFTVVYLHRQIILGKIRELKA